MVLGLLSPAILVLGIIGIAASGYLYYYRAKPVELLIAQKRRELAAISVGLNGEIVKTSKEIFQQLSEAHEAKVHPQIRHIVVDFARIVEAARGRGIILDTVECPNCKGSVSLPNEGDSFQCKFCGKLIHATDIFEKLSLIA